MGYILAPTIEVVAQVVVHTLSSKNEEVVLPAVRTLNLRTEEVVQKAGRIPSSMIEVGALKAVRSRMLGLDEVVVLRAGRTQEVDTMEGGQKAVRNCCGFSVTVGLQEEGCSCLRDVRYWDCWPHLMTLALPSYRNDSL